MKRRDFLKSGVYTAAILSTLPIISACQTAPDPKIYIRRSYKKADPLVESRFIDCIDFLKHNNWDGYVESELNISLPTSFTYDSYINDTFVVDTSIEELKDFGGYKWIEPGIPAKSLLYHLIASPRVTHELIKKYPNLEHIDAVENFIFDVAVYNEPEIAAKNTFFMVLSYEYRPAFQTPASTDAQKIAQLVYSKSGVARIGSQPPHYHTKRRCFTNKPADPNKEKEIAAFPARYGLFEVELVKADSNQIRLMNKTTSEYTGIWPFHDDRFFINPIRKVYTRSDRQIKFSEYHRNEKLAALANYSYDGRKTEMFPDNLIFDKPPFIRVSASRSDGYRYNKIGGSDINLSDIDMVHIKWVGDSSILIVPEPGSLVREAKQNGERVLVKVPKKQTKNTHTNRRYSAMKLPNENGNEFLNVISSDVIGRVYGKRVYGIRDPKNAPQFLNIKFEYDPISKTLKHIDGTLDLEGKGKFQKRIEEGEYLAQVFEDSICDGCVTAEIYSSDSNSVHEKEVIPALSFVTAPDFFELVDSNDIRSAFPKDDHFFEGGTLNLSTVRMRGNPNILNPLNGGPAFAKSYLCDKSFDTNLAVISVNYPKDDHINDNGTIVKERQAILGKDSDKRFAYRYQRDYQKTSYLPDTGTGVFYPAWDITYSNDSIKSSNHFLATIGLGSPFPEDMKLCAAANGMWPVTSPDAGRTFQGSLDYIQGKRPNTSIPLMDSEIGYHSLSPYVSMHAGNASYGWDGEQGPFIEFDNEGNSIVNYTDIERADYIHNLMSGPGFDMSKLRELNVAELVSRMDVLDNCIKAIEDKKVWTTELWLISATRVKDWHQGVTLKSLPVDGIVDYSDAYLPQSTMLSGEGYLFVFAKVPRNEGDSDSVIDTRDPQLKRRQIICEEVWVCQVTQNHTVYRQYIGNKSNDVRWTTVAESDLHNV